MKIKLCYFVIRNFIDSSQSFLLVFYISRTFQSNSLFPSSVCRFSSRHRSSSPGTKQWTRTDEKRIYYGRVYDQETQIQRLIGPKILERFGPKSAEALRFSTFNRCNVFIRPVTKRLTVNGKSRL